MLQMHVSVFNVGVIWLCKNMESENSHLCQHPPAQCMHSHFTHAHKYMHAHPVPCVTATRLFVTILISPHYVQVQLKKKDVGKIILSSEKGGKGKLLQIHFCKVIY